MTAWRSTSFGLSMARSWGETVSCQFWPSQASSSRATQSGSRANGDSILLHSHTRWHKNTGRGDGPISLSTDGGRCATFEVGKFFMWKGSQHSLFICTSAQLLGLTDITCCGHDAWTHLRLDRGVYGGVGFSRDLSLREWRERWYEEKPTLSGATSGVVWMYTFGDKIWLILIHPRLEDKRVSLPKYEEIFPRMRNLAWGVLLRETLPCWATRCRWWGAVLQRPKARSLPLLAAVLHVHVASRARDWLRPGNDAPPTPFPLSLQWLTACQTHWDSRASGQR